MGSLLGQLLPIAIVGAISPLPVMISVTLLMAQRGLAKATGFAVALVGVYALIGAITAGDGSSITAGSLASCSAW